MSHNKRTEIRQFADKEWIWPIKDVGAWRHLTHENQYRIPSKLAELVKNHNTVIQAGGHCGLYPDQYADLFSTVHTFEPHPENFFCLYRNVKQENVIKHNVAVGEKESFISLGIEKRNNSGKWQVTGNGLIPMITLDSLSFSACDLIHLDLEGYEWFALQGAEQLIHKFKPIIALETNDCCLNFGYTLQEMEEWIFNTLKYKVVCRWDEDTVYCPIIDFVDSGQ